MGNHVKFGRMQKQLEPTTLRSEKNHSTHGAFMIGAESFLPKPRRFFLRAFIADKWPIFILLAQNLVVFWRHYFRDFGFPWDFPRSYYGQTVIWTTLASQGIRVEWVPFSGLGIPIDLLPQSGHGYPPLWIFPIFHIPYSLHAAVVFQCVHVLLGAIGMWLFMKEALLPDRNSRLENNYYSLLGGFAFQFFGGFYSNAQNPDIIRAFSLAPWGLYLFSLRSGISNRHFFIPLFIVLLITGAYPGNVIAYFIVLGIFVFLQLIEHLLNGKTFRSVSSLGMFIAAMTTLGIAISAYYLVPVWLYKDHLVRAIEAGQRVVMSLGIGMLPSLFLDNALVTGETSVAMTSIFVTLPILILLSFIRPAILKKHWPLVVVTVFSTLMAMGENSFLWFFLTRLIEATNISRFPISDYRVFLGIGIIYFAIMSLKSIAEEKPAPRNVLLGLIFSCLWFLQGIYVSYPELRSFPVYISGLVFLAGLVYVFMIVFLGHKFKSSFIFLAFLILISLDAYRVLPKMGTWQLTPANLDYVTNDWPLERDGRLLTYEIIGNLPTRRPARTEMKDFLDYSWEGYITGKYTLYPYPLRNLLTNAFRASQNPKYKKFMLKEWTPLLLDLESLHVDPKRDTVTINDQVMFSPSENFSFPVVHQTKYGINDIQYEISSSTPFLMIENEIYFPGWRAELTSINGESHIRAIAVNDIFRAWALPAGDYKMLATFQLPHKNIFRGLSIIALLSWVSIIFWLKRLWVVRIEVSSESKAN